jgi:hypothetical protein
MLEVALGVKPEVLGRRIIAVEAVMVDEPGELRLRDGRLRRLDRVEDGECLKTLVRRPGDSALGGLRGRLPIEWRLDGSRKLVPQRDVLGLLARVLGIARDGSRARHADNRMAVLACIEREFLMPQLAALPALVEGVLQDVPALPGFIDPCAKLHFAP